MDVQLDVVQARSILPGVYDFQSEMRDLGIGVEVDKSFLGERLADTPVEVINIGCSLPSEVAVPVIQAAVNRWPQIRFLLLSSDHFEFVPDSIHYSIHIGGELPAKKRPHAKPWSTEEIMDQFHPDMGPMAFHLLVRSKTAIDFGPTTLVKFVGGPMDGEMMQTQTLALDKFKVWKAGDGEFYDLEQSEAGPVYRYRGRKAAE